MAQRASPNDDVNGIGGIDLSSLLPTMMMMNRGTGGGDMHWLQMLLVVVLPIILRLITPRLQQSVNAFRFCKKNAIRSIACTKETGVYRWWVDEEDDDAFNGIIQKSILAYINKVRSIDSCLLIIAYQL